MNVLLRRAVLDPRVSGALPDSPRLPGGDESAQWGHSKYIASIRPPPGWLRMLRARLPQPQMLLDLSSSGRGISRIRRWYRHPTVPDQDIRPAGALCAAKPPRTGPAQSPSLLGKTPSSSVRCALTSSFHPSLPHLHDVPN